MMLFEAMPLSLHSNKRKGHHSQEDLPLSKKFAAMDRQLVAKNGHRQSLAVTGSTDELDSRPMCPQLPASVSVAARKRKAKLDAELALRLQCAEPAGTTAATTSGSTSHQQPLVSREVNGLTQGSGEHLNGGSVDVVGMPSESDDSDGYSMEEEDCDEVWGKSAAHKDQHRLAEKPESDGKAVSGAGGASVITSRSMKQPSLVLTDLKKTGSSEDKSNSPPTTVAANNKPKPLYEQVGGYMRRMASLNASACVSAMMEPEKKFKPHKYSAMYCSSSNSRAPIGQDLGMALLGSSASLATNSAHGSRVVGPSGHYSSSPGRQNKSSTSSISSSEADTSKDSDEILDMSSATNPQVYTLLALASLAASRQESQLDLVPFNKLGLLYSGGTLHPNSRVFFTSDTELTLPDRIIPKVVPSRDGFVKAAIGSALPMRSVKRKRKAAKVRDACMRACRLHCYMGV